MTMLEEMEGLSDKDSVQFLVDHFEGEEHVNLIFKDKAENKKFCRIECEALEFVRAKTLETYADVVQFIAGCILDIGALEEGLSREAFIKLYHDGDYSLLPPIPETGSTEEKVLLKLLEKADEGISILDFPELFPKATKEDQAVLHEIIESLKTGRYHSGTVQ